MNPIFIFIALAVIAGIVYVVRRDSKAAAPAPAPVVPVSLFPCVVAGELAYPGDERAIAARNAHLARFGHPALMSDLTLDNGDAANTVFGGGPPCGGIYLLGSFRFQFDVNGQLTGDSWVAVWDQTHRQVTGGCAPDGTIGIGCSEAGVDFGGSIAGGNIDIRMAEAGMSVTKGDAIWLQLSEFSRLHLDGVWHGNTVEYPHARSTNATITHV